MTSAEEEADRALTKQAEEELLREACRGKIRAEIQGPSGWLKCPLPSTNKKFLKTTLKNNIASNEYKSRKRSKRSYSPQTKSRSSSDDYKRFEKDLKK